MLRSEIIEKVAELHPHLRYRDVERVVETIFTSIGDALTRRDRVEIRGFGIFFVKHRKAHTGRNPRTGVTIRRLTQGHPLLQNRQASAREAERKALASSAIAGVRSG